MHCSLLLVSDNESSLCDEYCCQFIHSNLLLPFSISEALCLFPRFLWYQPQLTPHGDIIVLSYFNACHLNSTCPELMIAASLGHFHFPDNQFSCLIFIHNINSFVFLFISLTKKLVLDSSHSLVLHSQASASSAISSFKEPLVCSFFFIPGPPTCSSSWFCILITCGTFYSHFCLTITLRLRSLTALLDKSS